MWGSVTVGLRIAGWRAATVESTHSQLFIFQNHRPTHSAMAKKRKTETSKAAPMEPLKNGKPSTVSDKQSPPASKRKKTGKNSATAVESGKFRGRERRLLIKDSTDIADTSLLDSSLKNTSNDFDDVPIPEDIILPPKEDLQILLNRIDIAYNK